MSATRPYEQPFLELVRIDADDVVRTSPAPADNDVDFGELL